MKQKGIRIFLAIAEHTSISGAARALQLSQQSVSEHLSQLEKKLGTQLVARERGTRQTMLTPSGEAFLPLARKWMELEELTARFSREQAEHKSFRLAASSYAHERIIAPIVSGFMREHPELEVRLSNLEFREIPAGIDAGAFDVAITYGHGPDDPRVRQFPLFEEERYILCPADTPLPDRDIAPEELDPGFEVFYDQKKENSFLARWYQQHFPDRAEPYFRVSTIFAVHRYLADPRCWAVSPAEEVVTLLARLPGRLTYRRFSAPPPPRVVWAVTANAYPDKALLRDFFISCGKYVDERPYLKKRFREEDM